MVNPDETFEGIFATYYRPVVRFFVARGFSREDAQDLAQTVFLQVFRGIKDLRELSSVGAWVFSAANNIWRNELRRLQTKKRSASRDLDDTLSPSLWGDPGDAGEDDPTRDLIAAERGKLLVEALAELPPQMRRCIALRVEQGLKYREIAEILQISIETVKSHLNAARTRLAERLGNDLPRVS